MKKLVSIFLSILILCQCMVILADTKNISVCLDGESLVFDVQPQIVNGRTMVPLRGIFEKAGAQVSYDEESGKIGVFYDSKSITLSNGVYAAVVNGMPVEMDTAPYIVDGRTMIPLRFISETVGFSVKYEEKERKVDIFTKGEPEEETPLLDFIKVKEVTAADNDGNVPANTIDGNFDTRWSAKGVDVWILFEMEKEVSRAYAGIAWYCGDERRETFDIYTSLDGENFTEIKTNIQSESTLNLMPYDLGEKPFKYVKLICKGNSENVWNSMTEFKVYPAREDGEMPVDDAGFEVKLEREIPQNIIDSLKRLDNAFGKNILEWMLKCYDPETGAFYANRGAAEYEGNLPNAESTAFAIDILRNGGICEDGLPDWWREKLGGWVQGLQSEEDGYFYHEQWGKTYGSRLSRDTNYALDVLSDCRMDPLYPTAAERIAAEVEENKNKDESEKKEEKKSVIPEYLQSEEAFIAYLDKLDWSDNGVWATGNDLTSMNSIIRSAGMIDVLRDYLARTQNPETGMWGPGCNKMNINGAMKLSNIFSAKEYPYPNFEKTFDAVLDIIENQPLGDTDSTSTVWNPIYLLVVAMARQKEVSDEIYQKLFDKGEVIIDYLCKETEKRRRPDGGYSSTPTPKGNVAAQGYTTGLGFANESDMNATVTISERLRTYAYQLFGLPVPGDYYKEYEEWFLNELKNKKPIEKKPLPKFYDFEDDEIGKVPYMWACTKEGFIETVADPCDPDENKCVKIEKRAGISGNWSGTMATPFARDFEKAIFTADIMLGDISSSSFFYCTPGGMHYNTGCAQFLVNKNTLANRIKYSGAGTKLNASLKTGEWYNLRVEYSPRKEGKVAEVAYYIDDELVLKSNEVYLGPNGTYSEASDMFISGVSFETVGGCDGVAYMDNVSVKFEGGIVK